VKETRPTPDSGGKRKPRRSVNDLRAPLMLLYVAAFCGGRTGHVPVWGLLLVAVPALLAVAWLYERETIREMLEVVWKPLLAAVAAAVVVFWILAGGLHLLAGAALRETLAGGGEVPGLFRELVRIRGEVLQLGPALAGICGALLLAPAEEIFWRGFLQHRLGLRLGRWPGLVVGVALYAGFYAVLVGPLAAIAAGITGLACAALALRSGSLVPGALCHALVWLAAIWLQPLY
jgi:membrane protease YdiL (CAAX protease family)